MLTTSRRRLPAAALSVAVVVVPGASAVLLVAVGAATGARSLREVDAAGALLALASLALAAVLAWATAAAAAGVVEAWSGTGGTALSEDRGPVPGASARGRGAAVTAGVAALVAAALTAPAAGASVLPPGRSEVLVTQDVAGPGSPGPQADDPAAQDPAAQDPAAQDPAAQDPAAQDPAAQDPDGGTAVAGSWSALAEGFRAPRGASLGAAALVTAQPSRPSSPAVAEVVVVSGDSLWSIAARHLGPGADAAEVAEAWPAWWDANRAVVGDDPDLLLPGQRLVVPSR